MGVLESHIRLLKRLLHIVELRLATISALHVRAGNDGRPLAWRDVLPLLRADGKRVVRCLFQHVWAVVLVLAKKRAEPVLAVYRAAFGDASAHESTQRSQPVNLRHKGIRLLTRLYPLRPRDNRRNNRSALEGAVLSGSIRTCRPMVAKQFDSPVLIAVIHHRTVVAAEDDE